MSCSEMIAVSADDDGPLTVDLCVDHLLQHQTKLQERLDHVIDKESSLGYKLRLLILQLPKNVTPELIEKIDEFKKQLDEIQAAVDVLQDERNGDWHTKADEDVTDDIECLRNDTEALKSKLAEIFHYSQMRTLQEQLSKETPSSTFSDASQSSLSDLELQHNTVRSSHQSLDRQSPLMSEQNRADIPVQHLDENDVLGLLNPNMPSKFTHKIQLSNNVVRWLRGPFKVVFNGTMHVFDVCAQGTRISSAALQAVPNGLLQQKPTNEKSLKPAFTDITPDWIYEGENLDRGFNSASIWMRDPQGRRILAKTQGHPLCAANEWLVYTLGTVLGLPVNEVQIGVYQNNLVTLHTDVSHANEKTMTFMELPKQARKRLMTDPIMGCMDLFDQIIQNADRNQRNILITMPDATDMTDPAAKIKIHLIDHASCFGMGKLSIISLIACKFHSNHLTVVKFDPAEQTRKFERYLSSLPVEDRVIIRKTLSRFSAITDERFDGWLNAVKGLLSASQYTRIRSVLQQQRDIATHYLTRWYVCPNDSSVKSNHITPENNDLVTYF